MQATQTVEFLDQLPIVDKNGSSFQLSRFSGIIGLYFCAGWCDDCEEFLPKLREFYSGINSGDQKVFEVVVVSSDESNDDMIRSGAEHSDWLFLRYDSPFRTELKLFFKICARKEMDSLGMTERLDGIPSLVLVDRFGKVIGTHGVDDISIRNTRAFSRWRDSLNQLA